MIVLNDYFHNEKKASNGSISVSGKLEAYIGNYFVSGEGILDEKGVTSISTHNALSLLICLFKIYFLSFLFLLSNFPIS